MYMILWHILIKNSLLIEISPLIYLEQFVKRIFYNPKLAYTGDFIWLRSRNLSNEISLHLNCITMVCDLCDVIGFHEDIRFETRNLKIHGIQAQMQ